MGKNRKGNPKNKDLGRLLIKDKNSDGRQRNRVTVAGSDSWRHTSDLQDGYDWNRINLQSVTEQDTLDEFLDTAAMAGAEFTAEKMNIKIVGSGTSMTGVLGEAEKRRIRNLQEEHKEFITIPRRPYWDASTTPEQLELKEKESFLNWRRSLALLQEKNQLVLTPYEKNLDIWRQLWRVIERSDVVCQIVDARNPLLYKCDDLEVYIKEVDPSKEFIVLVNKADYLTEKQRICWAEYFLEQKTNVIFWSALEELTSDDVSESEGTSKNNEVDSSIELGDISACSAEENSGDDFSASIENLSIESEGADSKSGEAYKVVDSNSPNLLTRSKLLRYFKTFKKLNNDGKRFAMIGLVGYPNVGKSSTINALVQEKKTAVSATPGKTKHFQTHFIDDELCLCDCPGLVFPSFVFTKAHLILNGILNVDQMRDHIGPIGLLAQHISRKIIENTYGINIVKPNDLDDPHRLPTAEEVLSSYAKMRGFMTSNGQPDCPRASRYFVKDYLKGKLLYCHPPPGSFGETFEQSQVSSRVLERIHAKEKKEKLKGENMTCDMKISSIDEEFFSEKSINAHYKVPTGAQEVEQNENLRQLNKPWKKHHNRNKKEKLRRVYNEC